MKKSKLKSLVKATRKTAQQNIEQNLATELKAVASKLVPGSKKIEKAIAKSAKKLAKFIAKNLVIDETALAASYPKPDTTEHTAKQAKPAKKVKVKSAVIVPVAKDSQKKEQVDIVPAEAGA